MHLCYIWSRSLSKYSSMWIYGSNWRELLEVSDEYIILYFYIIFLHVLRWKIQITGFAVRVWRTIYILSTIYFKNIQVLCISNLLYFHWIYSRLLFWRIGILLQIIVFFEISIMLYLQRLYIAQLLNYSHLFIIYSATWREKTIWHKLYFNFNIP